MENMPIPDTAEYSFIGGQLCLDFCNTGEDREGPYVHDLLRSYRGLVSWAYQAHLLTDVQTRSLVDLAEEQPTKATRIYEQAVTLREALYRLFSAIAHEQQFEEADLAILNRTLSEGLGHLRLQNSDGSFEWAWSSQPDDLDQMLWPVAKSASDLLLSSQLEYVRQCSNGNCSWLFLDLSRNHSRRWCDMESCGNRVKARTHRQRSRSQ